jgi:phytoene dehydrogenase-like protein
MSDTRCDALVLGAGLSGLVAGSLLAKRGFNVCLTDPCDSVGGRGGATRTEDGYWLDYGQRDGVDVGDIVFPTPTECLAAAAEAGVKLQLADLEGSMRVHRLPDGPAIERTEETFDRVAHEILGLEDSAALLALLTRWSALPRAETQALGELSFAEWLPKEVEDPALRRAILGWISMTWHRNPEQASVGRFIEASKLPHLCHVADDDEVGGMQGLMEPWARALRTQGAQIELGWKTVEILIEDGRAAGAVVVDRQNLVREIRAPVVIYTSPVWELFDLVDERRFPRAFVDEARAIQRYRGDIVGWHAGLRRLPTIRETGEPEHFDSWNRLLHGPECTYRGGFMIPSLRSRRSAPPGKHLLCLAMNRWQQEGSRTEQTWQEARGELEESLAYLRRFYSDLDECIEWSRFMYCAAPQVMTWWYAPIRRHAIDAPGAQGLLLASQTLEGPEAIGNVDFGAYAGRMAAGRALELLRS